MNKNKIGLLPCPFCGGKVEIRKSNDLPPCYGIDHYCGFDVNKIKIELRWYETEKEAVSAWNTRHIDGFGARMNGRRRDDD